MSLNGSTLLNFTMRQTFKMNICNSGAVERLKMLQNHLHWTEGKEIGFETSVLGKTTLRSISSSSELKDKPKLLAYKFENATDNDAEVDYPLTKSEAVSFLKENLNIPNPEQLFKKDKIAFLNDLTELMFKALPFSNVVLLGRPRDQRIAPTLEESKREVIARRGGSCFIVNTFNKAMLELMGYSCQHIPGNDPASQYNGTHAGLMVIDLHFPGSKDIVEAGTRRPIFEAIPIDFDTESPEYQFGHMRSKFIREDGLVAWYKEIDKNSRKMKNVVFRGGRKWEKQMVYDVNMPVPLSTMVKINSDVWPSADLIPEVHNNILVTGYSGPNFVSISSKYISIIDETLRERTKVARSKEELVNVFQEYFPQFTKKMVVSAIDNTIKSW